MPRTIDPSIRTRMIDLPRPDHRAPKLTREPWFGFTQHDMLRPTPLPRCPHARCRRAQKCSAAHEGLYCRRLFLSPAEQKHLPKSALQQALAELPRPEPGNSIVMQAYLQQVQDIRMAHHAEMTERWKAGHLDHVLGPYAPSGVKLLPPPRVYAEDAAPKLRRPALADGGGAKKRREDVR